MFHARNLIPQEDLRTGKRKAAAQEEVVRSIFEAVPARSFTPFEVLHESRAMGYDYNINGIRRAITDLTHAGLLRKTTETRKGDLGMTNRTWTWHGNYSNQLKLYGQEERQGTKGEAPHDSAVAQPKHPQGEHHEARLANGPSAEAGYAMSLLEDAKTAFLLEHPDMVVVSVVESSGATIGYLLKRTSDGREFYFYAVDVAGGGEFLCPSIIVNAATAEGKGLLIRAAKSTYAFRLSEVHKHMKGTVVNGPVQYVRIPVHVGVDVATLRSPIVKELMLQFGALPVGDRE